MTTSGEAGMHPPCIQNPEPWVVRICQAPGKNEEADTYGGRASDSTALDSSPGAAHLEKVQRF